MQHVFSIPIITHCVFQSLVSDITTNPAFAAVTHLNLVILGQRFLAATNLLTAIFPAGGIKTERLLCRPSLRFTAQDAPCPRRQLPSMRRGKCRCVFPQNVVTLKYCQFTAYSIPRRCRFG
jgi:hypothetical protein